MSGGGGGSIMDMIVRHRNNLSMLRKKSIFKRERSFLNSDEIHNTSPKGKLKTKSATKKQLKETREKTLRQRRFDNLKAISATIIILCLSTYISIKYFAGEHKAVAQTELQHEVNLTEDEQIKIELYEFYMDDAESWEERHQWPNAIYQYKSALKLFPSNFDANFQLASLYTSCCDKYDIYCDEAIVQLNYLLKYNPENIDILMMKRKYLYSQSDTENIKLLQIKIDSIKFEILKNKKK